MSNNEQEVLKEIKEIEISNRNHEDRCNVELCATYYKRIIMGWKSKLQKDEVI